VKALAMSDLRKRLKKVFEKGGEKGRTRYGKCSFWPGKDLGNGPSRRIHITTSKEKLGRKEGEEGREGWVSGTGGRLSQNGALIRRQKAKRGT